MTARSRHRGHPIHWIGSKWVYTDWSDTTLLQHGKERPCTSCGNRSNGPDFCLGKLPSVRQACCGHGHPEDAYFIFHNGVEIRGEEATRLRACWIHNCAAPGDVIEVYLRVLDVENTYRLCRLCNTGVTLPAVIKAIDTVRRNSLDFALLCDILEVYSKHHLETHMNLKAITNIQRQASILSDGHQKVVDQAVAATTAIIAMDDRVAKSKGCTICWPEAGISVYTRQAHQQLDELQNQLQAQSVRALWVRDEIEQIKTNLRIV